MKLLRDIRRIGRLLRPEAKVYALGLASLFVVNLADVLAPVFMAMAVDLATAELQGTEAHTTPLLAFFGIQASAFTVLTAALVFLGLRTLANGFRYPMLMYVAVPSHRIGQRLRNGLVAKLFALSRPFFDRTKSGDLMSLATADVNAMRMMLGPGVLVGSDTIFLWLLVIGVLLTMSVPLTLIALAPLPFLGWFTNRMSHREYQRFEVVQKGIGTLTERARESYAGIRIVQGYAIEDFDRARFEALSQRHFLDNLQLAKVRALFDPTLELMVGASTVLVLIFGGFDVISGDMSLGTFVAFLFLVGFLSWPMVGFGWSVTLFQRGRASMHRYDALLDEPIEIEERDGAAQAAGPGALSIRGLSFAYGGSDDESPESNWVLRDVDLDVPAGSTLGVIGPVGAGKTTLMNLLVRLYDPPPGTVMLDGADVRDLSVASLREHVVIAPQDTFLFSDTVGRNIALARIEALDDAHTFATLAQVDGEIDALPKAYDTMLGERGVNLSGGQRQRLAIARAIATDPAVLILDDCLSAVDAETEAAILGNLRQVFDGRTGIVVSHRVRAVRACDQIAVLEDGRVAQLGRHDELLALGGTYRELALAQSRVGETGEVSQ